jgi:hypothetical protein
MFNIARIVCISVLSLHTFHTPHTVRFSNVQERPIVASQSPVYGAPPPSPPPTPIVIWLNWKDDRNYGPSTDDYDDDSS